MVGSISAGSPACQTDALPIAISHGRVVEANPTAQRPFWDGRPGRYSIWEADRPLLIESGRMNLCVSCSDDRRGRKGAKHLQFHYPMGWLQGTSSKYLMYRTKGTVEASPSQIMICVIRGREAGSNGASAMV